SNLLINYLPIDMTEDELFDIFSKAGKVVKRKIVREKHLKKSLGYGFVEFESASAARIAQAKFNGYEIRGKSLKVTFAKPRTEDTLNTNLFVTFLPPDVDESKLATLFGCYGTITEVKVLRCKQSGRSRCSGFVRFDQRLAAEMALKALDNYHFKDAVQSISVKYSTKQTRHERTSSNPNKGSPVLTNRHIDPEAQKASKSNRDPS
ncbi:hypothetical protein KR200_001895, partial [Drosophila serrata]